MSVKGNWRDNKGKDYLGCRVGGTVTRRSLTSDSTFGVNVMAISFRNRPSLNRDNSADGARAAFSVSGMTFLALILAQVLSVGEQSSLASAALLAIAGLFGILAAWSGLALRRLTTRKPGEDSVPLSDFDAVQLVTFVSQRGAERVLQEFTRTHGEVQYSTVDMLLTSIETSEAVQARQLLQTTS